MTLEVRKRKKETNQSLLRRFQKAVLESGILIRKRQTLFRERNISETKKREQALYREKKKREYQNLTKR